MTFVNTPGHTSMLDYKHGAEVPGFERVEQSGVITMNKNELSAALLAALLSAAPALAADWAPATDTRSIATGEVPAPAAPSRVTPRDGQNYSGAEELLIKEFGVTGISMDIPEAEVMLQDRYYANAFCFEQALRQVLTTLLENYSNPTSPLAKALAEMGVLSKPSKADLKKARQKLMDVMNTPASLIAIVRPYKQNQPQAGETVEKNWVIFFRLENSPYWAIVERSGATPPYVYGTN